MRLAILLVSLELVAGCAGPSASPGVTPFPLYATDLGIVSPEDAATAKVDLSPLPDGLPTPAIDQSAAVDIAVANVGTNRGEILAVGRARARKYESSPVRTVWVVVFGPGGQVPITGPPGGFSPISLQLVAIDDQTGEYLWTYIKSAG